MPSSPTLDEAWKAVEAFVSYHVMLENPELAIKLSDKVVVYKAAVEARIADLEAQLAARVETEMASPCCWTEDQDGIWHTGCGRTWEFIDDGPKENHVTFCHHCGHPIAPIHKREE